MIDDALVRYLVDAQFPRWAGRPLRRFGPAGSDHVIYRLGDDLSVRLPRHDGAIGQAAKEYHWLPRLAPHLPLSVPVPVAVGAPDHGYPWPWAVSRWLPGEVATVEALGDSETATIELAGFLTALRRLDPPDVTADRPAGGSAAGAPGAVDGDDPARGLRGRTLVMRDRAARAAIAALGGVFDASAATRLWDAALAAPGWDRPPVWVHGDMHTGNLLTVDGRLSAVIDFGGLGVGDPAPDLAVAFTLMSARCRAVFRAALGVDDATWLRGRGFALADGLVAYRSYAADNARVAAQTTRQITAALAGP